MEFSPAFRSTQTSFPIMHLCLQIRPHLHSPSHYSLHFYIDSHWTFDCTYLFSFPHTHSSSFLLLISKHRFPLWPDVQAFCSCNIYLVLTLHCPLFVCLVITLILNLLSVVLMTITHLMFFHVVVAFCVNSRDSCASEFQESLSAVWYEQPSHAHVMEITSFLYSGLYL